MTHANRHWKAGTTGYATNRDRNILPPRWRANSGEEDEVLGLTLASPSLYIAPNEGWHIKDARRGTSGVR